MICCSEPWCHNGQKWKVCSYIRPEETEEQCQARVNAKANELKAPGAPLEENCAVTEEGEVYTILVD